MRKNVKAIIAGITFLVLTACSETAWVEITLDGTDITASFPSEPSVKSRSMTLPGMGEVSASQASLKDEGITYSVTVMTMNDDSQDFNTDNMAPHAMLGKGASLSNTTDVYLGSLSGKEFKMSLRGRTVIQRMFVDSNKLYTIVAIFEDKKSGDADKFLESVKL